MWPFWVVFWQLLNYLHSWEICQPWVPVHYWCWLFSSNLIAWSLSAENRKNMLPLFPLEAGQSGLLLQNVTCLQRWKTWVTSGHPGGLLLCSPSSAPLLPALFHGWLKTCRRALWSEVSGSAAKRDFSLLCKHPAKSPSLRVPISCYSESLFCQDADLVQWSAAARMKKWCLLTVAGLRLSWRTLQPTRKEWPECLQAPGNAPSASRTEWCGARLLPRRPE